MRDTIGIVAGLILISPAPLPVDDRHIEQMLTVKVGGRYTTTLLGMWLCQMGRSPQNGWLINRAKCVTCTERTRRILK